MSLSYYTQNLFFDDVIRRYLENDAKTWVRHERPSESTTLTDIDYNFADGMPICKIMSQMDGLEVLGNKRIQYQLMDRKKPETIGTCIPRTYPFSINTADSIKHLFDGRKYIVKPENGRGQCGIRIVKSHDECLQNAHLNKMTPDCGDEWILQEYIDPPLLYEGKKFHLRAYALLVMNARGLKVYVYEGGMLYFAKDSYDPQDLSSGPNLTGGTLGGSKRFPEDYEGLFGSQSVKHVLSQVKSIVKETVEPAIPHLRCKNAHIRGHKSFKMIAYDILIDSKGRCYLGEINVRFIGMEYPSREFKDKFYRDLMTTVHYPQKKTSFAQVGNYSCRQKRTPHHKYPKPQKPQRTPRKPPRTQKRRKRTQKLSRIL